MLRLPLSLISKQSISTTLELGSHRLWLRTYASSAVAARGWVPPEQRYSRKQLPNVRARRPSVNGQTVAFHVNELSSRPAERIINSYGLHVDIQQRGYDFQLQQQPKLAEHDIRQYESDMIVVLDMDECLIHSKFMSNEQDAQLYAHQLKQQTQQDIKSSGVAVDSFRVTLHDGTLVHVHVRPGLYDFLQRVCARYETHIFTAAMDIYANPVLDHIEAKLGENCTSADTRTKFAGRWYRQHCTVDKKRGAFVKNLNNLWPQIQHQQSRPVHDTSRLCRAVLVDNNPVSFLSNPENGILVSSFYTDPHDAELPLVWELLQELENEPDVRPALSEKFALKSSFEPASVALAA